VSPALWLLTTQLKSCSEEWGLRELAPPPQSPLHSWDKPVVEVGSSFVVQEGLRGPCFTGQGFFLLVDSPPQSKGREMTGGLQISFEGLSV
jgi:hypothetical protein